MPELPARFTLTIRTDGDAFADDPLGEVANILRNVVARIEAGATFDFYTTLLDSNGNDVGRAKMLAAGQS